MASHVKVPEGSVYVDPREIEAFVFSAHKTDKRAAQLTVYLKSTAQIHLLGDRAIKFHEALRERFPYRDEKLYQAQQTENLPVKPPKK